MTPAEQLLSFTGTLNYQGNPIVINYHRLKKLILDEDTSSEARNDYMEELGDVPQHLTTAPNNKPELFYFERTGDRYVIHVIGSGRYSGQTLSMEGPHRTLSADSHNASARFTVGVDFFDHDENLTRENILSDEMDVAIRSEGRTYITNYSTPQAPPKFTDDDEDDSEIATFRLKIIERNIEP